MRSRVLALFVALVFGLFCGWSGFASHGEPPQGGLVLAALANLQATQADAAAGHEAAEPASSAPAPAEPAPSEATHLAEPMGQAFAEGAPDLPALFLTSLDALAPSATMARPRPHAAAAWQHLYLNAPRRPPRALQFNA
jgi:hypothetical protein